MGYFDSRNMFLNRGELSVASALENLSRRAINFEVFAPFVVGKRVLDVGCCDGRWSSWMLDHGASSVHGIDRNSDYINLGALTIMPNYFSSEKYSFEVVDAFDYQPLEKFDVVALFGVLYYENPSAMIEKYCSVSDVVLVDTSVDTILVNGGEILESDVRSKFAECGFTITDLTLQEPETGRIMFVATKIAA